MCVLAAEVSANHLHHLPLSDSRYTGVILADILSPDVPLNQWIVFEGDDSFTTFSDGSRTMEASAGTGVARVVFDSPYFADATNPQTTALFEFEVFSLETSGAWTINVGFTDLDNQITWAEAAGEITGSKGALAGDDVTAIPPWSTVGNWPLRVQLYYHFAELVMTVVITDDALGTTQTYSWRGSVDPFENFFDDDIGGTDPVNLDIYPFVLCQAACGIRHLSSEILDCHVADGDISCLPAPGVGSGHIDPGETCDDGNTVSGDGCDENGQLEKVGRRCQRAISRAGHRYVKDRLRYLQDCRDRLIRGAALFQDREKTVAIADRSECPSEYRTARKLARTREKVRSSIENPCTDVLVGALGTCGETVDAVVSPDGTAGCLIETHDESVADLLTAQFGG